MFLFIKTCLWNTEICLGTFPTRTIDAHAVELQSIAPNNISVEATENEQTTLLFSEFQGTGNSLFQNSTYYNVNNMEIIAIKYINHTEFMWLLTFCKV